jgi:hypothetical protein
MQITIADAKIVIEKLSSLLKEQQTQDISERIARGIHIGKYCLKKNDRGYLVSYNNKIMHDSIQLLSVALLCVKMHSTNKNHELRRLLQNDKEYGKYSSDLIFYKRKMKKDNAIEKMVAEDRFLETSMKMTHIKNLMKSKMVF